MLMIYIRGYSPQAKGKKVNCEMYHPHSPWYRYPHPRIFDIQLLEMKVLFCETQVPKALITLRSFLSGIILKFTIATIDQFNKERKRRGVKEIWRQGSHCLSFSSLCS